MSTNRDTAATARNPRAEAMSVVGAGFDARVIEPSPPAVVDGSFFADDPLEPGGDLPTIVPAGIPGDHNWGDWSAAHPDRADWVSDNWLGGARRLPPVPEHLTATRLALHRLAAYVIAPVRHAANGKFGLRWTRGGFGTPFFNDDRATDRQIRVEGTNLIDQRGAVVRQSPITSLRAAVDFLESEVSIDAGAESDSPAMGALDEELQIDETAADFLGQWYGMAFAALEVVRADPASVDPSRPQLWPGHFDPAIEVGDEDHRASYGASPGDPGIAEPYLYVSVWWPDRIGIDAEDPAWNASSFTGAIGRLSQFPAGQDPVEVAVDFWRSARDRLEDGQDTTA